VHSRDLQIILSCTTGVEQRPDSRWRAIQVRLSPDSDRIADIAGGPFRANNGLLHRNKTRAQPITLSVRASTIGSVEPCYSIRIARRFIPLVL
jgi:hypothetical protein